MALCSFVIIEYFTRFFPTYTCRCLTKHKKTSENAANFLITTVIKNPNET